MIVTVHARLVTLWYPVAAIVEHRGESRRIVDDYPVSWEEARFEPLADASEERPSGARFHLPASRPIRVQVPAGSRVHEGRLIFHGARLGWDAATLLFVARQGRQGCRIEPEAEAEPEPTPPPQTWAVVFRAAPPSQCLSFAADGGDPGVVESTTDPDRIRLWPDSDGPERWLAGHGLAEGRDVPIGSPGWLYPHVEPTDPAWYRGEDWPRGVEFQFRSRGTPPPAGPPTIDEYRQQVDEAREAVVEETFRWNQQGCPPLPRPARPAVSNRATDLSGQLLLFGEEVAP